MKKALAMILMGTVCLTTLAQAKSAYTRPNTNKDVHKIVNFLIADTKQGGLTYTATAGKLVGKKLPLSFNSIVDYWGKYVCNTPIVPAGRDPKGYSCKVTDQYDQHSWTLTPTADVNKDSPYGPDLQSERLNATQGTNVYDASVWQIALGLAGYHLKRPELLEYANNQNLFLSEGYNGNFKADNEHKAPIVGDLRATDMGKTGKFNYGGGPSNTFEKYDRGAYLFRMVPRIWLAADPLKGSDYDDFIQPVQGILPTGDNNKYSDGSIKYERGMLTWQDWKPITGENSWAFLIGPLQTALLQAKYDKAHNDDTGFVPFESIAVQNAVKVLDALQRMQAPNGGLYYAAEGSLGNYGDATVDPREVSVENNASALGGFIILKKILEEQLSNPDEDNNKIAIKEALYKVNVLIYGKDVSDRTEPNGYVSDGLYNFFLHDAWQKNKFIQGGYACIGGGKDGISSHCSGDADKIRWQPKDENAVDVNTWTIAMLGVPFVDGLIEKDKTTHEKYGFGSAFRVWQDIKTWGGYHDKEGKLIGVGYSDKDKADGSRGILSGEWTAGAINMVRTLHTQYQTICDNDLVKCTEEDKQYLTETILPTLAQDERQMVEGMRLVRSDNYIKTEEFGNDKPDDFALLIDDRLIRKNSDKRAYLYASKRYFIPFGWYANPIPSAASTTWALMLDYDFNPFSPEGNYEAYDWVANKPEKLSPPMKELQPGKQVVEVVEVAFESSGMGSLPDIIVLCFKPATEWKPDGYPDLKEAFPCSAKADSYKFTLGDSNVMSKSTQDFEVNDNLNVSLFWNETAGMSASCMDIKPKKLISITWPMPDNHALCE